MLNKESGLKKPQKQEKTDKKIPTAMLMRLLFSTGIGLAVFALLMLAAAACCLSLGLAQEHLAWIGIPLAAIAALIAGNLFVRAQRKQGLLLGLLAGAALYVCVLLLAMAISRASLGVNAVLLLLAMLFGGAAGGIIAANRKPSERHSSNKNRRRSTRR